MINIIKIVIDKTSLYKENNIFPYFNTMFMEFEDCVSPKNILSNKNKSGFSLKYYFFIFLFCLFGIVASIWGYKYVRRIWIILILLIILSPLILYILFVIFIFVINILLHIFVYCILFHLFSDLLNNINNYINNNL